MLAFEIAAAMVALTAAPQHATPRQHGGKLPSTASRVEPEHSVKGKRSGTTCGKRLTDYDAKSTPYRDGRGERRRCTR